MENIATTGVLNHPQVLGSALSYLDRGMGPKLLQQVIEHCNAPAAPGMSHKWALCNVCMFWFFDVFGHCVRSKVYPMQFLTASVFGHPPILATVLVYNVQAHKKMYKNVTGATQAVFVSLSHFPVQIRDDGVRDPGVKHFLHDLRRLLNLYVLCGPEKENEGSPTASFYPRFWSSRAVPPWMKEDKGTREWINTLWRRRIPRLYVIILVRYDLGLVPLVRYGGGWLGVLSGWGLLLC